MPDKRKHRGQHPKDHTLFTGAETPKLRRGLEDLTWLLTRGYPEQASLKLVGDRFRLRQRQRMALSRCSCSLEEAAGRRARALAPEALSGQVLYIDGFNLLITIESALSDGFLFEGVDGCYRDLASIHGSYKRVMETEEAIRIVGRGLEQLRVRGAEWLLDRPVSNSGKLLTTLYELANTHGWNWEVNLYDDPDQVLVRQDGIIISSDSLILDQARQWFNLARYLTDRLIPRAGVLPLGAGIYERVSNFFSERS